MDVLCELYPVEMTAIFASKRIFAAAATGGARTAELPTTEYQLTSFLENESGNSAKTPQFTHGDRFVNLSHPLSH